MKQEEVKALSDNELAQVITWADAEQKARTEKRRQDTIARIKELAASQHIVVSISGARGRPARVKSPETPREKK